MSFLRLYGHTDRLRKYSRLYLCNCHTHAWHLQITNIYGVLNSNFDFETFLLSPTPKLLEPEYFPFQAHSGFSAPMVDIVHI